jgi:hypothetical protein
VFNKHFEQIVVHARSTAGKFSSHLGARGRRCTSIERDTAWWLNRAARIGRSCGMWAMEVVGDRGAQGIRTLQGLINLAGKHSAKQIEAACERALSHGAFRLKDVKRLISLQRPNE